MFKTILAVLFASLLALNGVNASQDYDLPCDKPFFQGLCNPNLKLVEKCYDCYNLRNGKEKCFPAFKQLDITDFLSSKRWNCSEHEHESPVHSNFFDNDQVIGNIMDDSE
jgi:hypothetical protein